MLKLLASLWQRAPLPGASHGSPRDRVIALLDSAIAASTPQNTTVALICLEIDNFRLLEESCDGRDVAQMLRVLEQRIATGNCGLDTLRHLGAGRYAVILSPQRPLTLDSVEDLALHIQGAVARPILHPFGQTQLTVSIGYALHSEIEAATGSILFEAATLAMMEAARSGQAQICAFAPPMQDRANMRSGLALDAGAAIRSGAICAFFQPQVNMDTQQVIGFEALARWYHPERGIIAPCDFLPILEQSGLMQEFGLSILRQALCEMRAWDRAGLFVPTVSINMSTSELRNPNLIDAVQMELDAYGLKPERLIIEVLETVVAATEDDLIIQNLRALGEMGCQLDLDDFGTGQASITAIRRFGVDRLKIDRSFVSGIDQDRDRQEMVTAILTMADRLNVHALAEGVETAGEMSYLNVAGCLSVQGYAVSRPMPAKEVLGWLHQWTIDRVPTAAQRYVQ